MRVCYFTAGSHGAGHLVRAVALQRAIVRGRHDIRLDVVAPASPLLSRLLGPNGHGVVIDAAELRDPTRAAHSAVAQTIAALRPDVVVIDVFWVPLVFVPLPCPAWLLLRSVPAAWLVGPREARFDPRRYERVFAIEPAPGLEAFEATAPVVVSTADERLPRRALAERLRVGANTPLNVIVQGGLSSDASVLAAAARDVDNGPWHLLDVGAADAPFPVAPLLAEADRVVAAPGYNTFWEAQLLGFSQRTTWVPIRRQLDDAAWRASLSGNEAVAGNGADTIVSALAARANQVRGVQPST
jgi:hypothetical protein